MRKYTPNIKKEKKKAPKIPIGLLIFIWLAWFAVIILDIYRFVSSGNGISAAEVICDVGVLAVAIYFTVTWVKENKNK